MAWRGMALPLFSIVGCSFSFFLFSVLFFLFLLLLLLFYCCFVVLILSRFRYSFIFFHSLYIYPLMVSCRNAKTNRQIRVYLYVCIMCWIAQSSRLFSCVVYAVFLCTFMFVPRSVLLPLHGQTFAINFSKLCLYFVAAVDSPFVCVCVCFFPFCFCYCFFSHWQACLICSLMDGRRSLVLFVLLLLMLAVCRRQCDGMRFLFDSHRKTTNVRRCISNHHERYTTLVFRLFLSPARLAKTLHQIKGRR